MKPDAQNAPAGGLAELGDDQAAEFAALQAGAVEAAAPGAVEAVPLDVSLSAELVGIAGALLAVMGPVFPSVKAIYTEDVTAAAAAALAAVCVKHGWLSGGLMGEYAEELTAVMVCGPLAFATAQAVKADIAAKSKAPQALQAAERGAVAGNDVLHSGGVEPDPAAPKVLERG